MSYEILCTYSDQLSYQDLTFSFIDLDCMLSRGTLNTDWIVRTWHMKWNCWKCKRKLILSRLRDIDISTNKYWVSHYLRSLAVLSIKHKCYVYSISAVLRVEHFKSYMLRNRNKINYWQLNQARSHGRRW
jgi:hypothetical protein